MKRRLIGVVLAAILAAACLAACSGEKKEEASSAVQATESAAPVSAASTESEAAASGSGSSSEAEVKTVNVTSNGVIDASGIFTERDLTMTADTSQAVSYNVSDGKDITITEKGVYVISGTASNASVIVDAPDDAKVQIVLNGVSITNGSEPCIYIKNADKVFVTTAEGTENSLSVTGEFTADGDTKTDAVIFSKDDLVLNGLGTLNISSSDNGVSCKDDLKITGGSINITCASDALEANDSIAVADGNITMNTQKDGLHAENDEDNSKGYIYICGGNLKVTAGSDGVQGTTVVQIDGGTLDIDGSEGIEGTYVQINGGKIAIDASDDGINGSAKSSSYNVTVEINGGDITINMGQGDTDGIDSNGDLFINGGTVSVNAQSPFDCDGQAQHNGGTIIVNGTETNEITNQFGGGMGGGMGGPGGMDPGMGGGFGRP